MKGLITAFVVVVALGAGAVGAAAPPSVPPANADNDHLFTSGDIMVPPGDAGVVAVVMTGPTDRSSVPMIVRNNTASTVYDVSVTGIARDSAGTLKATGASRNFEPSVLEPGDWAIGYVNFDIDVLAPEDAFEFSTGAETDAGLLGRLPVAVSEAVAQPQGIVGLAVNEGVEPLSAPVSISVACFSDGALAAVLTGYTDGDTDIAPGGFAPFTVSHDDNVPCEVFAVAGSGWSF